MGPLPPDGTYGEALWWARRDLRDSWFMHLVTWMSFLYFGDDAILWFWAFMRFVIPGATPQ